MHTYEGVSNHIGIQVHRYEGVINHVHTYICAQVRMRVCLIMYAYMCTGTYEDVFNHVHTYVHRYEGVSNHVRMHIHSMRACLNIYICTQV